MIGWHHGLKGHEFEQTPGDHEEQASLACCSSWGGRVRHNLVTEQRQNCPISGLRFSYTGANLGFVGPEVIKFEELSLRKGKRSYKYKIRHIHANEEPEIYPFIFWPFPVANRDGTHAACSGIKEF